MSMQTIYDRMIRSDFRFYITKSTFLLPTVTDDGIVVIILWHHSEDSIPIGKLEQWNYRHIGIVENSVIHIDDQRILDHIIKYRKRKFNRYIYKWMLKHDLIIPAKFNHSLINLN